MPRTKDHPLSGDHAELFEAFLGPNGIVGWMPENAHIVVDTKAGTITWPRWRHLNEASGPWDRDVMIVGDLDPSLGCGGLGKPAAENYGDPVAEHVTVPMAVPVTDHVRDLCRKTGLDLVER